MLRQKRAFFLMLFLGSTQLIPLQKIQLFNSHLDLMGYINDGAKKSHH